MAVFLQPDAVAVNQSHQHQNNVTLLMIH